MKTFRFRLQKVMEVKEDFEKKRMAELADAKKLLRIERDKLEDLKNKTAACQDRIKEKHKKKNVNPTEMELYYRYLDKLRHQIEIQFRRVCEASDEMERRRQVLLCASKERKVLEKLRERKYSAFREEMTKKEQDFIDELATTSYVRAQHGYDG